MTDDHETSHLTPALAMFIASALASKPARYNPERRTGGSYTNPTQASHEQSKTRRKMAAKSNRINRLRCKGWKH
jgi:hypothetical protein